MEDKIHNFGPWTPARFVPVPFLPGAPAWFITTARICRGIHDERCAHGETQTFGPLTAVGTTAAEVFVCARCHREQPPVNEHATGEQPVCLFCSDASAVLHAGDSRTTTAGITAVAALYAAATILRTTADVRPGDCLGILDGTADSLRVLLELKALEIKQEPSRAAYMGSQVLLRIARQIVDNARQQPEPFPVREADES